MELTNEQLQMFRQPFEKTGAFVGLSEEEIKKLLGDVAEIYVTLARIKTYLKN